MFKTLKEKMQNLILKLSNPPKNLSQEEATFLAGFLKELEAVENIINNK